MNLQNILFIDIETVTQHEDYEKIDENLKTLWEKKCSYFSKFQENKTPKELYFEKGGIYSEFGKAIVIGIGAFSKDGKFKVTSIFDVDEKKLLANFKNLLITKYPHIKKLCAHNGKEFDFPYLCRRMLINSISLPQILDTRNKKPWEIENIDTMELWKFGDKKSYTSLDLLANIFHIPSSKELLDGSKINEYFYIKKAYSEIIDYCIEDVITLMQVFLRLNCLKNLSNTDIEVFKPNILLKN